MKPSLLDTDIFSEVLKGRHPNVSATARNYRSEFGHLTVSTVTIMEIVAGFWRNAQNDRLDRFLRNLALEEVLSFDEPSADIAGRIFADLQRTGQPVGRADPMIAGIALRHGLIVVTGNVQHFRRIQELGYSLELENWRDASPNDNPTNESS